MTQRRTDDGRAPSATRRDSPWRWGLLLTLRDRLDNGHYSVPADAVAESIIDRTVSQRREERDG